MKQLVEIYFPIIEYHLDNDLYQQEELILKEIEEVLKRSFFNLDDFIISYTINIEVQEPNSKVLIYDPSKPFLHSLMGLEKSLKIVIGLNINLDLFVVTTGKGKERVTDERELLNHLPYSISEIFGNILLLAQIARPCSLKHREGIIYINKKIQSKIIPTFQLYEEQMEFQKERGYPKIEYLKLTNLYNWITKNDFLFPERPSNNFEKALNNLSFVNDGERY